MYSHKLINNNEYISNIIENDIFLLIPDNVLCSMYYISSYVVIRKVAVSM